jgi:DNA-binding protein H-NS
MVDDAAVGLANGHHAPSQSVVASTESASLTENGVQIKYRDPVTGDTWTGRGRMATWLRKKQDAGEDIEKYLVARK